MLPAMTEPTETEDRPLGGLFKHSVIYSATPVIRQLISIGMHRLYTGWLARPGMGVKENVDFWLIGFQQLLGGSALGAMLRFYYEQKDERDRASLVTSCTLLISLAAWIVCGTAFFFSSTLAPWMLGRGGEIGSADLLDIVQLILILVPFQLSTLSGLYYLQALKRSSLYTTIQTAKLFFEVTLNFILIGHFGMGVEGFLTSILAGEMLTSLFLCGWMFKTLGIRIDLRVMRPVLAYAMPLIPVGLCQLALHFVDRRLLLDMVGQGPTGVYGHGYKIGFLVTAMMLGPFIQIWHPWIFGVTDSEERARLVGKVSTYAVLAIAAASLGVIAVGRQAAILLASDEGFWVAYEIIPYVASGYVFWALYHVSQLPLLIAKRTGRLFSINFVAVIINVGLNLLLIPRMGIVGAGIATLTTFATLSVLCMGISRSEAHVPFELGRLAGGLVCVVAGGAFTLWIDTLEAGGTISMWTSIPAKLAFLLGLLAVLYFAILRADERRRFMTWVSSKRLRA